MEVPAYVAQLRHDGERISTLLTDAGTDLDAPVPSCPDWCLRDLVRHLGGVHRWATGFVRADLDQPTGGDLEDVVGGWPTDAELGTWFADGHHALVGAIEEAPADLETWTFLEAPSPLVFWARRQAHETAIHRVDAELALGQATGFRPAFAVDGIDELLLRFLSRPGRELPVDRQRTMAVRAADADRTWRIALTPGGFVIEPSGDVTGAETDVCGSASDLYVWLWNRSEGAPLDVTGDRELLDVWREAVQIRWS